MSVSQRVAHYRERSRRFLSRVDDELAQGEPEMACEALWGAAALAIKAAAEQRGRLHREHRLLRETITRLVAAGAPSYLRTRYFMASDYHRGFYESIYSADQIAAAKAPVAEFIRTLEGLT